MAKFEKLLKSKIFITAVIIVFLFTLVSMGNKAGLYSFDLTGIIFKPIQSTFSSIANSFNKNSDSQSLRMENEQLKEEIVNLNKKISAASAFESMQNQLEETLQLKDRLSNFDFLPADIISKDAGNWSEVFVINKGSADGIGKGNVVVFGMGLVGKIISSSVNTSKVQTIIDPESAVGARITSNRSLVEVVGDIRYKGSGQCLVKYIDNDVNIMLDEYIETSGLEGSIFPKGIIIGKVVKIDEGIVERKSAVIQPLFDINSLETVFVLKEKIQ